MSTMGKGEIEALHDTYCAGYHNLPRMVKRHLSLHDTQEIWFCMVRPVVDTLTAELERVKADYSVLVCQAINKIPGETRHETARRIISQHENRECNAAQAKAEPQVPEGYQLVPIFPTDEMTSVGVDILSERGIEMHDHIDIGLAYKAMLSAAKEES